MTRWTLAAGAVLVLGAIAAVTVARALGWSGTRLSVLGSIVALWLTAYVLWGFAGGLAAHYGLIERYDGGVFAAVAVAGAWCQYRAHLTRGRDRGLTVFVAAQLLWLVVVMARNGFFVP
ncbi:MAG TPA: hypothetical protein VGT02_07855 [Methylomirabilota bacterium]|jgi:hypothetical protein|nr:hypothetical protein [Methylomirabilota bacterium]